MQNYASTFICISLKVAGFYQILFHLIGGIFIMTTKTSVRLIIGRGCGEFFKNFRNFFRNLFSLLFLQTLVAPHSGVEVLVELVPLLEILVEGVAPSVAVVGRHGLPCLRVRLAVGEGAVIVPI